MAMNFSPLFHHLFVVTPDMFALGHKFQIVRVVVQFVAVLVVNDFAFSERPP
jgi:hypothetical protein